jgi:mannose-6-phosphate isomerase-like protein (cupin superfamily)
MRPAGLNGEFREKRDESRTEPTMLQVETEPMSKRFHVVDFAKVPGVACPCGLAHRAFSEVAEFPGTIHVTEIESDAARHYHRHLTETYYILECGPNAKMELDNQIIPLKPGLCVLIPPGVRHRALGAMKVLIIVLPKFDPADEFLD